MSSQRSVTIRVYCLSLRSSLTLTTLLLLIHGSVGQNIPIPEADRYYSLIKNDSISDIECPERMIWTKESNDDADGFCACIPGHLYSAEFERCFMQYTQGPCKGGQHFVLRANETEAKCVDNPCPEPSTILYKGECHKLYVPGVPCGPNKILVLPRDTFQPRCVGLIGHQLAVYAPRRCPRGHKKDKLGKCRKILFPPRPHLSE